MAEGPLDDEPASGQETSAEALTRSRKKVTGELRLLSRQLTDRSRFLAAAIVASSWALMHNETVHYPELLKICIILAICTLTADFLQYAVQYSYFYDLDRKMNSTRQSVAEHNQRSWRYRSRWWLFHTKIGLVGVLSIFFCVAAGLELVKR